MKASRRDVLKMAAVLPAFGAANERPLPPIATSGGIRVYPTAEFLGDVENPIQWWKTLPVYGWDLPTVTSESVVSLGATPARPDTSTTVQDGRNTPFYGPFTRAYFQFSTPPLNGPQALDGVVSAAIHAIEANKRINAMLALQVVVHRPDTSVRGVALPLTLDTFEFTAENLPKSRAAQNWPLSRIDCEDGDLIAINLGLYANNLTNSLAYSVGFSVYANQSADISRLDDPQLANTWVEFSAPLVFYAIAV